MARRCPPGFEEGLNSSCHVQCASGFSYVGDRCVYDQDKTISYAVAALPMMRGRNEPAQFDRERARANSELALAWKAVADKERDRGQIAGVAGTKDLHVSEYERIRGDYAEFNDQVGPAKVLKEVANSLTPFRPPTAPASDIEKERKAIVETKRQDLMFIQIALFLTVLVLVGYIMLPRDIAHVVAFMLVVVGIAIGFFLPK